MNKLPREMIRQNRIKAGVSISRYSTDKFSYVRRRSSADTGGNIVTPKKGIQIYIGPSVEGPDVEYIARVSGKVSNRLPSFVITGK